MHNMEVFENTVMLFRENSSSDAAWDDHKNPPYK